MQEYALLKFLLLTLLPQKNLSFRRSESGGDFSYDQGYRQLSGNVSSP